MVGSKSNEAVGRKGNRAVGRKGNKHTRKAQVECDVKAIRVAEQ